MQNLMGKVTFLTAFDSLPLDCKNQKMLGDAEVQLIDRQISRIVPIADSGIRNALPTEDDTLYPMLGDALQRLLAMRLGAHCKNGESVVNEHQRKYPRALCHRRCSESTQSVEHWRGTCGNC